MDILDRLVQSSAAEVDALRGCRILSGHATVLSGGISGIDGRVDKRLSPTGIIAEFKRRARRADLSTVLPMSSATVEGMPPKGAAACGVLTDTLFPEEHLRFGKSKPCGWRCRFAASAKIS